MRTFDRLVQFDEASRNYPIRALTGDALVQTKYWDCEAWLDQGNEGACVGFSWAHDIIAEPVPFYVPTEYARWIYQQAKRVDEWPGEDYEGTSVLAGAKVMQRGGWIAEYRWAFGLEDLLRAVSYIGPVIVGSNWYEGMLDTDANGYVHPTGWNVGGHAYLIVAVDVGRQACLIHNSWGKSWGVNGRAWIKWEDLDFLLREDGEACVPLVRTLPEVEPEPVEPEPKQDNIIIGFLKWLWSLITFPFR